MSSGLLISVVLCPCVFDASDIEVGTTVRRGIAGPGGHPAEVETLDAPKVGIRATIHWLEGQVVEAA